MKRRATTALIAAAIVILGVLLYATRLGDAPPYLIHDEAMVALHAHAVATTARDLNGRLLPLYFAEPGFIAGRDPLTIYVTALGLKVLPFTEAGVRIPTALVAVLDLVLMFFAARAIFHSTGAGVVAAMLMMLAPIHFLRGRLLLSPLYSIPFVLGWLWSLAKFNQEPTARRLVSTCLWLALGMYSYLGAVMMMPLYLLMTLATGLRPLRWRSVMLAGTTMVICLLPMAAWYLTHPERNSQLVSSYGLGTGDAIGTYAHLYWSFFDPSYLFLSGDSSLVNSTRTSGLFSFAFAILMPIGFIVLVRSGDAVKRIIAAGLLLAPIVSVISGAIEMNRVMFVVPFAVLVATTGVVAVWQWRALAGRAIAVALTASIVIQFGALYRYYTSDAYRVESATWFSGNMREAARELIARADQAPIYISEDIEWVAPHWRFYTIEAGRADLLSRTTYVMDVPESVPVNAKLLCMPESSHCAPLMTDNRWRTIATVASIDGRRRYVILERTVGNNKAN